MELIRVVTALTTLGREAARMVLPSRCVICRAELPWTGRRGSCCGRCWEELPRITGAQCRLCAIPLPGQEGEQYACVECTAHEPPLDCCAAWGAYEGGLDRLLHAFKFEGHDFLAADLAELLVPRLSNLGSFDHVVPIPMHAAKVRQRGYNQAELLARELSFRTAIPLERRLLIKQRNNATQSTLPRSERAANVREAFRASERCGDRSILLVDDISTTGETLRAAARELKRCGASRVGAITVARVSDSHP